MLYTPPSIVAGTLERRPGEERQQVWHAACRPCRSEVVSAVLSITAGQVHFLAVPTRELAGHPDSWCPFAAVLPGRDDAEDGPVVYTVQEGQTLHAMVVDALAPDPLRILSALPSQLEPELARLGHRVVALDEAEQSLRPVPWVVLAVSEERLVQETVRWTTWAALAAAALFAAIGGGGLVQAHLVTERTAGDAAALEGALARVLAEAQALAVDPAALPLGELDRLYRIVGEYGGTLLEYRIEQDGVHWRALLPALLHGDDVMDRLKGRPAGREADGRILVVNR